jgi:N-acetylmuramoyl-L-alanine amidase
MTPWSPQRARRLRRTVLVAVLATVGVVVAVSARSAPATEQAAGTGAATPAAEATAQALDPKTFATGSCVAYAPTHGDRHQTVFLDAGHGGPDPGGVGVTEAGQTLHEREMTLPVVTQAAGLLRAAGFRVVVSRTTNGPVAKALPGDLSGGIYTAAGVHRDTAARPICANLAKADALVSVHYNFGASPKNAGAMTVYDASRPFAAQNLQLATLLQDNIIKQLHAHPDWDVPDVGVVKDGANGSALTAAGEAYGHLLVLGPAKAGYFNTPSLMPGALVEPLFLTDPFEGTLAASKAGQLAIATGIADAVERFLTPSS